MTTTKQNSQKTATDQANSGKSINPAAAAAGNSAAKSTPELDRELHALLELSVHPEQLLPKAFHLAKQNHALKAKLEEVIGGQEALRQELQTLCQPEHYPAVIQSVERNGTLQVELQVQGMSPVRASVHPDVNSDELRVGATCYVSKNRNCVLEVSSRPVEWRDMGTYEESLPDGRIVIRHRDQPRILRMTDALTDIPLNKGDRIGFHEETALACEKIAPNRSEHLFAETPEDSFSELGGLESQIRILMRTIDFIFRHPHTAKRFHLPGKRGILLTGPPGNGKTRMARCVASYIRELTGKACRFQSVVGSEDYSMWLGGSETKLKERFAAAREAAQDGPCVIFIDELDALGRRRGSDHSGGAPDRILSTLLGLMDDVHKTLAGVVLIGATNRADSLDPGLTRPGRFDLKILVPPPSRRTAEAILRQYLSCGLPLETDHLHELTSPLLSRVYSPRSEYAELVRVRFSDGRQQSIPAKDLVSGAMFEHVVRQAAEEAAVREVETGSSASVTAADLDLSLERELFSTAGLLSPENVKAYVQTLPRDAHPVEVTPLIRGSRQQYLRTV